MTPRCLVPIEPAPVSALEDLAAELTMALRLSARVACGEVTLMSPPDRLDEVLGRLMTRHGFEQVVNFAFSSDPRAAADDIVIHLLSVSRNQRLRLRSRAPLQQPQVDAPSPTGGRSAIEHRP